MEDQGQANFSGWAVLELFGRTKEVGYVTTRYFGGPALFQIDVPNLPEHTKTVTEPGYYGGQWCGVGSEIKQVAREGRSCFVGPSAIFRMTPCSEEAAMKVLNNGVREIQIVKLNEPKELPGGVEPEDENDFDDGPDGEF